jgi:hypothetical protein
MHAHLQQGQAEACRAGGAGQADQPHCSAGCKLHCCCCCCCWHWGLLHAACLGSRPLTAAPCCAGQQHRRRGRSPCIRVHAERRGHDSKTCRAEKSTGQQSKDTLLYTACMGQLHVFIISRICTNRTSRQQHNSCVVLTQLQCELGSSAAAPAVPRTPQQCRC